MKFTYTLCFECISSYAYANALTSIHICFIDTYAIHRCFMHTSLFMFYFDYMHKVFFKILNFIEFL